MQLSLSSPHPSEHRRLDMPDLDACVDVNRKARDSCTDAEGHVLTKVSLVHNPLAEPAVVFACILVDRLEHGTMNKQASRSDAENPDDTILPNVPYRLDI